MQAEGIRNGDRYDQYDAMGRVVGGWTAIDDASVFGGLVTIPVRLHNGRTHSIVRLKGEQVALSWGVGSAPAEVPPKWSVTKPPTT